MVTGSTASNLYAEPRMTRDLDVVIELGPERVDEFVGLFGGDFYIDGETARSETASRGMFNVIDNARMVKIDFILRKAGEYHDAAFARRRQGELEGTAFWVISPEDLVLAKLMWAKPSHSEMQLKDARNVLLAQPGIDRAYLDEWAAKLGVADLLEEVSCE